MNMRRFQVIRRWTAGMLLWSLPPLMAESATAAAGVADGKTSVQFAERDPRYRLDLTDEIEVEFRFTPEFNQKLTVQPDGFVALQDVGDLKVAGMTLEELRQTIVDRYSGILNDPVVTVKLVSFSKPYFIVGGQVAKPGKFDLQGDITMTDAIAIAGGFNSGARASEVLLFRRVSQEMVEVKRVDVKMALQGNPAEDIVLRPGDSLYVPRSKLGKLDRFLSVTRLGFYFPIPIP